MIGQQEKAVQALHEKSQSHFTQEAIILTRQIAVLSFIHLLMGALQPAEREAERLGMMTKRSSLAHAHSDIWSTYLQGCCFFQTYDLARAQQYLSLVAEQKYNAHTAMAISGLAGLALTYQAMQQTTNANQTIDEMINFAHETNDLYNLHMAHSCQARLSLLRGDVKTAKQWLDTFDEAPDVVAMSFFLEIPSITQCRVLIGMGLDTHLKEAAMRLERLWEATQAIHNTFQMIEIGVLRAQALQRMSHLEEALAVLDHVVNLSAPGGWIRPYVELDSPMAELLKRLRTQHTAVDYIDEILAAFESTKDDMWLTVANSPTTPAPSSSAPPLDEPLLAQRYQDKEIAAQLCIAPTTVKTHLKHLYQKLQVSTRRQAVAKGHALGLLTHR
jgi:LuxR family maltose regulon positive regulatory protein